MNDQTESVRTEPTESAQRDRTVTEQSDRTESERNDEDRPPSIWKNANYRRLFAGRLVTNAGDSLYSVAMMWLVYDLSGSSVYTGIAGALLLLPHPLQFVSGPIVDRWPLARTLVATQLLQGIAVLSIPVAAYTGTLTVGLILLTVPFLSLLNQFVYPAQSAALPRIVRDEQLTRANSALKSVTQGLDMVFEAVGGLVIAVIGAVALFVADALTFVLSALLFGSMAIPAADGQPDERKGTVTGYVADLRSGVEWLRGTVFVEDIFVTAVSNFTTGVALAILPAFAAARGDGLALGPTMYGALLGALGVGRLLGSVAASWLENVSYGRVNLVGFAGASALWLGSVFAPRPWLTVALFALAWIPAGVTSVMTASIYQTVVPDHLIGRVSSVSAAAAMWTLPVGAAIGGVIGSAVGAVTTMALAAFGFGFVSLWFAVRPPLRRLPAMTEIDPAAFGVRTERPSPPVDSEE